jgi:phospholipid/cholesterol/gamma-HCH transport system permease protein
MPSLSPVAGVRQAGSLFALFLDVFRLTFKRPFQGREFVQQAWFVASVTIFPTMLVSIPFGAVIALELGTLARQIGAQSFTGSASVLAIIREASPIVCALLNARPATSGAISRVLKYAEMNPVNAADPSWLSAE